MVGIVVIIAVVLVAVIYYLIRTRYETTNRIRTLSHSIDELHRELYEIEKKFSAEIKSLNALQESQYSDITERCEQPVYDIEELSSPIMESLDSFEKALGSYKKRVENRLCILEERLNDVMPHALISDEVH